MQNTFILRLSLSVFRYLFCVASLHVASAQSFDQFLSNLNNLSDSSKKSQITTDYLGSHSIPIIEDSLVHFIYRGKGNVVAVPGEMNGWDPSHAAMMHMQGTDLFFHTDTVPIDGRVEYKLWVDSSWILDPLNLNRAKGGYGENSEVRMPYYRPPSSEPLNTDIPHGKFDTLWIESKYLHLKHAVIVYTPFIMQHGSKYNLPLVLVTDGIDYLTFTNTHLIIDGLIRSDRIEPIIAAFIEPRTELHVDSTNKRMTEYAANEVYLDFLEKEVVPRIEKSYPISDRADDRLIIGASMGGLISTYAGLKRPDFIGNCATQSPAYRQGDSAVIKLAEKITHTSTRIYMQTGTIHDTENEARYVHKLLEKKGAQIVYEEIHEGHNWTNWRTHLAEILQYFFRKN